MNDSQAHAVSQPPAQNGVTMEIANATLEDLRNLDEQLKSSAERLKIARAAIEAEVTRRTGSGFNFNGKLSGDVTDTKDGVKLKASISKKVEWDTKKLMAVAADMPWDKAQQLFKFELSVPEAIFNALTDEALKQQITDARTVKYGELRVTFAS